MMLVIRCVDFVSAIQMIKRWKSLGMSKRGNLWPQLTTEGVKVLNCEGNEQN